MSQAPEPLTDMLTRKAATHYLNSIGYPISLRTLENMARGVHSVAGPPFIKFSWNSVRYNKADLIAWAKNNARRVG